jgi:hypothetical protein
MSKESGQTTTTPKKFKLAAIMHHGDFFYLSGKPA